MAYCYLLSKKACLLVNAYFQQNEIILSIRVTISAHSIKILFRRDSNLFYYKRFVKNVWAIMSAYCGCASFLWVNHRILRKPRISYLKKKKKKKANLGEGFLFGF